MPLNYVEFQGKQPILNFDLVSPLRAGQQDALAQKEFLLRSEASQRDAELQPLRKQGLQQQAEMGQFSLSRAKDLNTPDPATGLSLQQREDRAAVEGKEAQVGEGRDRAKLSITKALEDLKSSLGQGTPPQATILMWNTYKKMAERLGDPELLALVEASNPTDPKVLETIYQDKVKVKEQQTRAETLDKVNQIRFMQDEIAAEKDPVVRQQLILRYEKEGKMSTEEARQYRTATMMQTKDPFADQKILFNRLDTLSRTGVMDNKGKSKKPSATQMADTYAKELGDSYGYDWKDFSSMKRDLDTQVMMTFPDKKVAQSLVQSHSDLISKNMIKLEDPAFAWKSYGHFGPSGKDERLAELKKAFAIDQSAGLRSPSSYSNLLSGLMRISPADYESTRNTSWSK